MYFKSVKSGKVFQIRDSDINEIEWLRAARGYEVKIVLKDGSVTLFGGFKETVSVHIIDHLSPNTFHMCMCSYGFNCTLATDHFSWPDTPYMMYV